MILKYKGRKKLLPLYFYEVIKLAANIKEYLSLSAEEKMNIINEYVPKDIFYVELNNKSPYVIHKETGLTFAFIPEGYVNKGLSDLEFSLIKKINNNHLEIDNDTFNHLRPQHKVFINNILISTYPVSWEFVSNYYPKYQSNKGAAWITKNEIDDLCSRLNMRLPSDDEWEYAARCGKQQLFPFGNFMLKDDDELEKWLILDYDKTKMNCNELGLYGLFYGEWTNSRYTETYSEEDMNNPTEHFCIRGGAAQFYPWQDCGEWIRCACAYRMSSSGLFKDKAAAFRLVYDLSKKITI